MNHDPTAAADPARLPRRDDSDVDPDEGTSTTTGGRRLDGRPSTRPPRSSRSRPRRRRSSSRVRRAKAGIAKKLDFMTNLMSSLDVLVFAELSVLYYMEYVYVALLPLLQPPRGEQRF